MELEAYLSKVFGFTSFKPGQKEVIEYLVEGKNVLAVLPTGTGKSLCYQLMGSLRKGTVVIVSPLLSLMEDQLFQLQKLQIGKSVALNSTLSYAEKKYILAHLTEYRFIFLSPEMLLQQEVRQSFKQCSISLLVIDEAHCISQWGIDFRPEYTKLSGVQKELGFPQTLALTATATPEVKKEIIAGLFTQNQSVKEVIYSVDRENISLMVQKTMDKDSALLEWIKKIQAQGIIYCSTRKTAERLNRLLQEETELRSAYYHGGMATDERGAIQQQFVANQLEILCATNAFGMGIDKPDVRFVIHYDCPDSLENYVQEIGRAGRDGLPSLAVLLYKNGDEMIHHYFQEEIRNERAWFEQQISINEGNLSDVLQNLTELQQKWLQGYLEKEYSLDELEKELVNKEAMRKKQLEQMLLYIHTNECRRNFILAFFKENKRIETRKECCDCCGLTFDNSVQKIVKSPKAYDEKRNWQEILLRIFKEKRDSSFFYQQ